MATVPLVVDAGFFEVDTVDFSDAIDSITLSLEADEVEVPQTLSTPKTTRLGARTYKLNIKYLSNDTSLTAELFSVFWTAIEDADGLVDIELRLRPEVASATNPQWEGTIVVTSASVGADVGALSEGSGEFTFTAKPTRAVAP